MEKEEFSSHISKRMNRNIEEVFNGILEMGGLVEHQIENTISALTHLDRNRAEEVIILDETVNQIEVQVEKMCANILARQQPTASDLRLTIASIRIAIDLERMGDEVVKIARMVKSFSKQGVVLTDDFPGYSQLLDMSHRTQKTLHVALDCFARLTVSDVLTILDEEETINELYEESYQIIISALEKTPNRAKIYTQMLFSAKAMERSSDHIENIVEKVVYLINGKDIRTLNEKSTVKLIKKMTKRENEDD